MGKGLKQSFYMKVKVKDHFRPVKCPFLNQISVFHPVGPQFTDKVNIGKGCAVKLPIPGIADLVEILHVFEPSSSHYLAQTTPRLFM